MASFDVKSLLEPKKCVAQNSTFCLLKTRNFTQLLLKTLKFVFILCYVIINTIVFVFNKPIFLYLLSLFV